MFKPFQPPLRKSAPISNQVDLTETDSEEESLPRPAKKRRLLEIVVDSPPSKKVVTSSAVNAPRKPLLLVKNPTEKKAAGSAVEGPEGYYSVLWYEAKKPYLLLGSKG